MACCHCILRMEEGKRMERKKQEVHKMTVENMLKKTQTRLRCKGWDIKWVRTEKREDLNLSCLEVIQEA